MSGTVGVSCDLLASIARGFDLAPWQLYVQGLDPELPPSLSYISQDEIALYDRIKAALKP